MAGRFYHATEVDDLRESLQLSASEIERLMIEGVKAKVVPLPRRQKLQ